MARHFYDPPVCPEDCAEAGTKPLWGWYTAMLVDGLDWGGEAKFPRGTYESGGTKPRRVEYYPGEYFEEPEQAVSNKSTTGKLLNGMKIAGWCIHQAEEALSRVSNLGGAYYVWRCVTDSDGGAGFLAYFWAGSFTAEERDEYLTTLLPNAGGGRDRIRDVSSKQWNTWKVMEDGYQIQMRSAQRLLSHIAEHRALTANQVQRSGVVNGRAAARYVEALKDAGLITITAEDKWPCGTKRVSLRPANVVRPAEPEDVEAALSVDNLPDEDRPLWESLRRLYQAPAPASEPAQTMTLDDILSATDSRDDNRTPKAVLEDFRDVLPGAAEVVRLDDHRPMSETLRRMREAYPGAGAG